MITASRSAICSQHFDAERSLPRDHGVIVKWMDKSVAVFLAEPDCFHAGLVVIGSDQDHLRAIFTSCGYFDERRRQRHADHRRNSPRGRVVGHGLRVVSRRCCDHSAALFLGREQQDFVQRAAFLERAGHLAIFELQKDRVAGLVRQLVRRAERRDEDRAANAIGGLLDGF